MSDRATPKLTPGNTYRWLVAVPHRWRRQLSFEGRRLTVGQFVEVYDANGHTEETAAVEFDLPVDAVREALAYRERHHELLDAEAREERRRADGA